MGSRHAHALSLERLSRNWLEHASARTTRGKEEKEEEGEKKIAVSSTFAECANQLRSFKGRTR